MKHVKTHTARDGQQRLQPACYKHININYEQCSSVNKVQPDLASEISLMGSLRVKFWSRDFLGVLLGVLGIFGGVGFLLQRYSIISITWNPEYPLGISWGFYFMQTFIL